jgi:hypothetical protein
MIISSETRRSPWRRARARPRREPSASGRAAGVRSVQAISARPTAPTPQNTGAWPARSAATPMTGPSSAPAIAAPIAEPIICPRCARGAAAAIQPIAPAHDAAPPTPCTKRATSSTTMLSPNAKATLETVISASPSSTVCLTPARAASQPPGSPPANVPAG